MQKNPAQQLYDRLKAAKNPPDFHQALRAAYSDMDKLTEQVIKSHGIFLACKKECHLCCYLRVEAGSHEVLTIADYVESNFSGTARAALNERLQHHQNILAPLSCEQHKAINVPCPLLIDGKCIVYEVRPFSCRRHQSERFDTCQYSYDHPDDLQYQGTRNNELYLTIYKAELEFWEIYVSLGFDSQGYELGAVLKEALSNPKCRKRWRKKIKTFLDIRTVPFHISPQTPI